MNNPFVIRQSEALADRLLAREGDDADRLAWAYGLCYARPPSDKELKNAQKFIADFGRKQTRRAAWAALSQALLVSAEFCHR
jgi:hypothetical protein